MTLRNANTEPLTPARTAGIEQVRGKARVESIPVNARWISAGKKCQGCGRDAWYVKRGHNRCRCGQYLWIEHREERDGPLYRYAQGPSLPEDYRGWLEVTRTARKRPRTPVDNLPEAEAEIETPAADPEWPKIRKATLERDGRRCVVCGARSGLSPHHIKSRQDGGEDMLRNLITLCCVCHDKTEDLGEFGWAWIQANRTQL